MNLRNLEQIQEQDPRHRPFPFATLLLAAMAGGALVVVATTTFSPKPVQQKSGADALDRLLAEQQPAAPAVVVAPSQVTFPSLLSDEKRPTTALAVVRDERGRLLEAPAASASASAAPMTTTPLPSSVLPAGDLLSATNVTRQPKDDLVRLTAGTLSDGHSSDEIAPAGQQGGYEIQVASFRSKDDADAFVQELRKRGHRAYRQAAYVPDRGLWHRVRVGSFKSKYKAKLYKTKFEKAERISTFLVDPDKIKRQKSIRDAKEQARLRKKKKRTLITAR